MTPPLSAGGSEPVEQFVLRTDQAPEFWQFLNGLRGDDLLVELIVNELDARSPRTEIRFEADGMVCAGSGDPVDAAGWERLGYIKGAGHEVAPKIGMFGVKNHGLKACFTLGDSITLRSAGRQILQTLFKDGTDKPPYPGVRIPPREDPDAPARGTRIEVPFRRTQFTVPHGEKIDFAAVTDSHIEHIFNEAVGALPRRLLGIMRPGLLGSYELVLSHHILGTRTLSFRAGRVRRENGLVTFFRDCTEIHAGAEKLLEREQVCLTSSNQTSPRKARFFQAAEYRSAGKRVFGRAGLLIEVAWDVDAAGKLKGGDGRLRYPVAYPGIGAGTSSGVGAHYSGAFISDTERHRLAAQSDAWNETIICAADQLLADALAKLLIPRHGAKALELVGALDGERLKVIINRLLETRALPAVDSQGKAAVHKRGSTLVIPAYKAKPHEWSAALAKVAPSTRPIVDPKTPASIVDLLASGTCAGWNSTHLRFDEDGVLDRLRRADAEHFPWRSEAERQRSLGNPAVAKEHLDALESVLVDARVSDRPEGAAVYMPDAESRLHPLADMKRGASIPSELQLSVPPTIHPDLRGHPVFKLEKWILDRYELRDLLRGGEIANKPITVRRRFFAWLAANPEELAREDWPAVKGLSIWPSVDGSLHALDSLCLPEPKVATILGSHIAKPTREVRALVKKLKGSRAHLSIREEPSAAEVQDFYTQRIVVFPTDRALSKDERTAFHALEAALVALSRLKRSAGLLRTLRTEAVGLCVDGALKSLAALVRENVEVSRLALKTRDLIDRPERDLDQVLPPARRATPSMVLDALLDDPAKADALLPRLEAITATDDPQIAAKVRQIPCLPHAGELVAPDRLAFKGNLGELWGGWKVQISGEGLADNVQEIYRRAGVIRGMPTPETSRAYFVWLNEQTAAVKTAQINCILRHAHHPKGVDSWLMQPPEIGCIPVEHESGVELLPLSLARRFAVFSDMPELADAIRDDEPNPRLRLAIDSVQGARNHIAEELRRWGLPTLSSVAAEPVNPNGRDQEVSSTRFLETVHAMASANTAKLFRKQLKEFDVSDRLVEPQFQRRLLAIKRVVVATDLTVQFKVRGRNYRAKRERAVLPNEIWLDRAGDLDDLLMKAIADIVFFKPRARWLSSVLKDALRQRTREFQAALAPDDYEQDGHEEKQEEEEVGESSRPHPGSEPDPRRNDPKPEEIYSGGGGDKKPRKSNGPTRRQVVAEDIQRVQLKTDHYASHCQIELARHAPAVLAPEGSYSQHAENRIRMLEAHHPDKTSANGARHAGNLLILSKVNHDRIGTRLSRGDITAALRDRWRTQCIKRANGSTWLDGGIAQAIDRLSGQPIPIFFTNWHRDYWLKMASA